MALVTVQVVEGLERGQVFADLATPVTIGREDDNRIRLNDERVSRFHAKIQEDDGRIILTDLDSTNGTRVNGHPVQMRVLQVGDQLSIGRCLLIYGSREEITAQIQQRQADGKTFSSPDKRTLAVFRNLFRGKEPVAEPEGPAEPGADDLADQPDELFPDGLPNPPKGLRPAQKAELSDFLAYVHEQIRIILQLASEEPARDAEGMQVMGVDWSEWQRLLKLEMDLAVYLRNIADPEREEP